MNPIATKRPGVYSQYAVTSLYARPVSERAAALAGVFPEVEGVTRLSRYSEAAALLEGWALAACSLLFGRGVAAVYLSPAATDTAEGYAAAFAALEPVAEVGCILCDKAEEDILGALQESCQRASEGSRERLGFCGVDDSAAASSLASFTVFSRMV